MKILYLECVNIQDCIFFSSFFFPRGTDFFHSSFVRGKMYMKSRQGLSPESSLPWAPSTDLSKGW